MKILLVEDDRLTASVLSELLTAQHYNVEIAIDGESALSLATASSYDLLILDVASPKLNGFSVCLQLRSQGYQKPILVLTHKVSSVDIVQGLDAGADDYVVKPYNLPELLARIRALLRRSDTLITPTVLIWGNLCVNPISAEVTYVGQPIALTPKEYGLLGLFLRHPQQVFSRSDIVDRLWSIDAMPAEGTVTNLIKDLRHKLKAGGMVVDLLETVYGLGYRLKTPAMLRKHEQQSKLKGINEIIERYQTTFAERTGVLAQVEQVLRTNNLSSTLQQSAAQEAHKLAGVLGSFGYKAGSRIAAMIEHLLLQPLSLLEQSQFSQLLTQLNQELQKPPEPLAPHTISPGLVVLVLDDDLFFTRQLRSDAIAWGFKVQTVIDLKVMPDVVLLDLSSQATIETKLTRLQDCQQQFSSIPILVSDRQGNLTARVAASRLRVQRFLQKPMTTVEVFEAILQVLPRPRSTQAQVMVIDDDALMLKTVRDLLQPWGLAVTILQDPTRFWDVLTLTRPDLLLLDLQMPTFSGVDLCRVVRQDLKWGDLPILVITAHTDLESIQQAFAAGADDFISKPIAGPELITRIISRIDRSRLQQELETMKRRIGQ